MESSGNMGHCETAGIGARLLTGVTVRHWGLKCLCPGPFLSLHLFHGISAFGFLYFGLAD